MLTDLEKLVQREDSLKQRQLELDREMAEIVAELRDVKELIAEKREALKRDVTAHIAFIDDAGWLRLNYKAFDPADALNLALFKGTRAFVQRAATPKDFKAMILKTADQHILMVSLSDGKTTTSYQPNAEIGGTWEALIEATKKVTFND